MKKLKYLIGVIVVSRMFFNCANNNDDLPQETTNLISKSSSSFNEIISAGEEVVYEVPSDHVEENSSVFEEEFSSIETIDAVRYNDFHLLKVTGQNLDEVPSVQYYSMDEIIGTGTELSNGGGSGNYCTTCTIAGGPGVLIYYYYMRPDGTLYLRSTTCFACPPGLDHALSGG